MIFVLTSLIYCQTLEHLTEKETYKNPVSCHHLTHMLHCLASKHVAVTEFRPCHFRFCDLFERSKNFPKCLSLIVTFIFYIHGSKLMLFSCRKYFILDRPSRKLPSALPKNCVSIVIYLCINICFCIKPANKICTFGPMLLFYEGYIVLVSHQGTNPAGQG